LVASDSLQEEGDVFKHYYNRVNALLQTAPNVGIDDILQAVFHDFNSSKNFISTMEKVKLRVKKLQDSPEMQIPEVREAVAEFYKAVQMMVLSHSSIVRVTYILSKKLSKKFWSRLIPQGKFRRGLCTVEFAEFEAKAFGI
jgi:aspartate/methionine/tyrosine aminotransferase